MKTFARSPQRGRLLSAVAAATAALSFAVSAAPASAAPFTATASGGRTVEFSAKKFTAGLPGTQRFTVKGTGWVGTNPGGGSQPVVAFKLDNLDTLAGWGGDDRFVISTTPNTVAFKANADTGNFEGWIDLPTNLAKVGPGTGVNAGQHWIRILAGAFSTTGNTGNVAAGASVQAFIDALDAPVTGFQQSASNFIPGTFIPATGTSLKVTGNLDTTAVGPVAVTFDGAPIANARNFGTQDPLTTNANGDFTANVPVPANSGGVKILSFSAGGTTQSVAITVTARTAARQTPQASWVGETVTVNGTGFRQINGAGQKVGLLMMPGDKLLGCGTADAEGNVSVSGTVPEGTELGDKSLWLAVGAACIPMGQVVEPPAGIVQLTGAAGISVVVKPLPTPTPVPTAAPVVPAVPVPTGAPTPSPVPTPTPLPNAPKASKVKSTSKGSSIEITFGADAAGASVKVGAKTKSKVKLTSKAKAKIVTVASTKTVKASKGKAPKVVVKLTADGKKLLKARGSLKIVITIQQTGRATVTKTVTIKP